MNKSLLRTFFVIVLSSDLNHRYEPLEDTWPRGVEFDVKFCINRFIWKHIWKQSENISPQI